jgi:MatE
VGIGAVLRRAMGWAALCIVPFALLAFVEPALPLSLFTSDPELVTAATSSLRVVSLAILLAIPAEIIYSAVSGSGNTRTTLVIELVLWATVLRLCRRHRAPPARGGGVGGGSRGLVSVPGVFRRVAHTRALERPGHLARG